MDQYAIDYTLIRMYVFDNSVEMRILLNFYLVSNGTKATSVYCQGCCVYYVLRLVSEIQL